MPPIGSRLEIELYRGDRNKLPSRPLILGRATSRVREASGPVEPSAAWSVTIASEPIGPSKPDRITESAVPISFTSYRKRVMQQVKLFKSVESELEELEKDMNDWMKQNNVKVISIQGNIAPQTITGSHVGTFSSSDILMIVHYETTD
jgi:hypothetical protein